MELQLLLFFIGNATVFSIGLSQLQNCGDGQLRPKLNLQYIM